MGLGTVSLAYASTYSASMILDPPPSSVTAGNTITFSGTLMTSDGKYVISGKTISIKDDIAFGSDTFLGSTTTDNSGRFSVSWTASVKNNGNAYHVYAVSDSDSQVSQARSSEYTVSVTSQSSNQASSSSFSSSSSNSSSPNYYYSTLILDPIPSVVNAGDIVSLSGTLMTQDGKYVFSGQPIFIKDDVTLGTDTSLGSVVTDANGKFLVTWKAVPKTSGGSYNFYAVFNGNSQVQDARSLEYRVTVVSQSSNTNQGSSSSSANTNYLPTEITLDPIPTQVYAENEITFSGKVTSNGQPLTNALVHIQKDIPAMPDEELAYGNTDVNGRFLIHWTAQQGEILKNFGIYAIFEGGGNYAKVRSNDQYLTVQKYVPQITLDQFPTSANVGDVIQFTGSLQLSGASLEGDVVFIKDEVSLEPDNLLATAYVDSSGHYSTNWVVRNLHTSGLVHVYAVFEGDKAHSRVTTCDTGPTSSLGGSCLNTVVLSVSGTNPLPPPLPLQPQTQTQLPPSTEKLTGNEYINLYYSLPSNTNPVVVISPSPDSYADVVRYVTPVENGIRMWTNDLQQKYGGNWNVEFEVLGKDLPHFDKHPDVIVNIVTQDKEVGCIQEFGGVTYVLSNPIKPVNIEVCANNFGQFNPDWLVSAYSAHEFIHAMGLGHAWNKEGDLMCSYETQQGTRVNTCPNLDNKSPYPSDFDLAAVAQIYGTDGFVNPNNAITYGTKFTANAYQSMNYGGITNPATTTQTQRSTDQSIVIPSWVKNNAQNWSLGQITDSDFASGLQYLIKQGIIKAPFSSTNSGTDVKIPFWVKSNAKLWAAGEITDQDFVNIIQYLIYAGMIKV